MDILLPPLLGTAGIGAAAALVQAVCSFFAHREGGWRWPCRLFPLTALALWAALLAYGLHNNAGSPLLLLFPGAPTALFGALGLYLGQQAGAFLARKTA